MLKRINLALAFTWPLFIISIKPEVKISGEYFIEVESVFIVLLSLLVCENAFNKMNHPEKDNKTAIALLR
jgi:hypothetical protein